METIRGRMSHNLDLDGLKDRLTNYNRLVLDLGTGDGRYVRTLARSHPNWFVIGVDACRENLHEHSRARLENMLFVIANAQELPCELSGLISHVTINFPWGSLLEGLLAAERGLMGGLISVARPETQIEIHLNGGALEEAGTSLEAGAETIYENVNRHGWNVRSPRLMDNKVLKNFPSTWARRLAYGRDPRAIVLTGKRAH
ncbi:MAG TPA: class I SAM-dependent methyltransferase [Anaerolineales bacterium]|nr:class I SAM-dependent methyltransferase [Anaerolineales bacterium]